MTRGRTLGAWLRYGGGGAKLRPRPQVFSSCSSDSSLRIWDIRAPAGGGAMLCVDHAHPGDVNVISWGGAGRGAGHHLLSGGDDGSLRLWDLRHFQVGRGSMGPIATHRGTAGPIGNHRGTLGPIGNP